ncbi:MAG: lyase [Gemmatimonadales bacterium]
MRLTSRLAIVMAAIILAYPHEVSGQTEVDLREWTVPWASTRPRDPFVQPDGTVWFVGQQGNYIGRLDTLSGEFDRFELPAGAGPHNLIVDASGEVWYAGNRAAHIGRLDPETGDIETIPMPDPRARDPHTLVFDSAGNIWFTVQRGGFIGHLDVRSREVRLMDVGIPGSRPYGITLDGQGRPWVNLFGTNKIAIVDPAAMEFELVELPRERARSRRIATTSDGMVWYVDYVGGFLGRIDPTDLTITEWPMPSGPRALPYGMAVDDRDRVWFVETGVQPNRFVGFDPAAEVFAWASELGSGGGTVRHMYFDSPSRSIWFGTDRNTVGRAVVP